MYTSQVLSDEQQRFVVKLLPNRTTQLQSTQTGSVSPVQTWPLGFEIVLNPFSIDSILLNKTSRQYSVAYDLRGYSIKMNFFEYK